MTKAELEQLKARFDRILDNVLDEMRPGWDDSVVGFNKAWDIIRDIMNEEIRRAETNAPN